MFGWQQTPYVLGVRRLLVVSHLSVKQGPQGKHRRFNSFHSHCSGYLLSGCQRFSTLREIGMNQMIQWNWFGAGRHGLLFYDGNNEFVFALPISRKRANKLIQLGANHGS